LAFPNLFTASAPTGPEEMGAGVFLGLEYLLCHTLCF
jgi:hypothetical protein